MTFVILNSKSLKSVPIYQNARLKTLQLRPNFPSTYRI